MGERCDPPKGFPLFSTLRMASPDTILLIVDYRVAIGRGKTLQMYDWLALSRLPFTSLHRLWIHFLQLRHKIELLLTPFLHAPQGNLPFSFTLSFILQPNITFIFPIFIFKPLASNPDFHFIILSRRLSSLCAIVIKSSAYCNSRGKPAHSFLVITSITIYILY